MRLDYVESSNGCYIDSGIVPDTDTTVKCKYDFVGLGDNVGAMIFGQAATAGTRANLFGLGVSQVATHLYRLYGAISAYFNQNYSGADLVYSGDGRVLADGVQIGNPIPSQTFTTTRSLYIFAENYGGNVYRAGRIKLYYLQILNGSTLQRDFIPVLDWNDVPCLYDKVSGQLFYNQGTGTLYAPPNIMPQWQYSGVFLTVGASTVVSSAMEMSGTVVDSGNTQYVYNSGYTLSCVVSGGGVRVSRGGLCSTLTLYTGAIPVYTGGRIVDLAVSGNAGATLYTGGLITGAVLSGLSARITISNGGSASDIRVGSGALVLVSSGGFAGALTIEQGRAQIYNGGDVNNLFISSAGGGFVSAGARLVSGVVSGGGSITVSSGGTGDVLSIIGNGRVFVYTGGTAYTVSAEALGRIGISGVGAYVSGATVIDRAWLYAYPGGSGEDITIDSGGSATAMAAGGLLSNVTVLSAGSLVVQSGGTALAVTAHRGITLIVYPGGSIDGLSAMSGYVLNQRDSLSPISNTAIFSGATNRIFSGGTAYGITVESGGTCMLGVGGASQTSATLSGCVVKSGGTLVVNGMSIDGNVSALAVTSNVGASITVVNGGYIEYA